MRRWQHWLVGLACAGIVVGAACRVDGADAPIAVAGAAAPPEKAALDLSFIPATAVGAVVVRPQPVFTGPGAEWLPLEVLTAAGLENAGLNPVKIKEAVVIVTAKQWPRPEFGLILRFTEPYSNAALLSKLPRGAVVDEALGKKFLRAQEKSDLSFYLPDATTLVVAPELMLRQMVAAKAVDSPLTKLLGATDFTSTATAVFSVDAVHDMLKEAQAESPLPPLPPALQGLLKLPDQLSAVLLEVDLRGNNITSVLTLQAHDAATAADVETTMQQGLDMARQMIQAQMKNGMPHVDDPVQAATAHYTSRMTNASFEKLKPVRHGTDVSIKNESEGGVVIVAASLAYLLPATHAARGAARRISSMNNLRQIGLGLFVHESNENAFPAHAIFDKQGKPLLSWRVRILPYIDQTALFERFHLDEPWDSAPNKPLIALMPQVYNNPARGKNDGTTTYLAPVGKGLAFEGDKKLRLADFTDGLSNTILIVEANEEQGVPWTKPTDLEVDLKRPLQGLGSAHEGRMFNVLFANGSVHTILNGIKPQTLKALFTRNGGEVFDSSEIDRH